MEVARALVPAVAVQAPLDVRAELVVEVVGPGRLPDDQGRVARGQLGREPRAALAERGGQHRGVGPIRHRQELEKALRGRFASGEDGVEDRRVRAARVRHLHGGPRDAATEHAGELAQEDRVPLREGPESLLVEPEEPRRGQGDDRGRARVARDQRHLPQAVAGSEDGHPLAQTVTLAPDLDGAAHHDVERVAGIALREHRAAGGDLEIVELAHEAGEDLARELGEERYGPERRDDRVHRSLVAGTLDGRAGSVKPV